MKPGPWGPEGSPPGERCSRPKPEPWGSGGSPPGLTPRALAKLAEGSEQPKAPRRRRPGRAIPRALKISYENSLFSGMVRDTRHIRSGQIRQWEKYFSPALSKRFLELFGDDALVRLGYESDHAWAAPAATQTTRGIRLGEPVALHRLRPTEAGQWKAA